MPICRTCQQEKPVQEFSLHTSGKPRHVCKECDRLRSKIYYQNNKNKILSRHTAYNKRYYAQNREKILTKSRKGKAQGTFIPHLPPTIQVSPPQMVLLHTDGQYVMFDNCRRGGESHKKSTFAPWVTGFVCQRCLDRENQSLERKIFKKIKTNLRLRLKKIIKAIQKKEKIDICKRNEMLGCPVMDLKHHLEQQFTLGMSWENYGTLWHIDHIRPCSSFDLTDVEEQKRMNHFTNLQPLWAEENRKKGDTYETNTF